MRLVEHSTLGPYRLERPDTAGPAFRSWRARKLATGEAMRVTFPSAPSSSEVVSTAEADAVERSLRHVAEAAIPGVPAAQAQWEEGLFFVASPVPAGRSLADMIEQGWPERLEERLGIAAMLANLVATAHEAGVAHGQLSPEMVYVHPEGRVTLLECGIHPMLSGGQEQAARADVAALGRLLYRYFAGEWPEQGDAAAQRRNLERLPAALPRSMARKIVAAASGNATEVPSARNLAIHLALDKAWVKAMSDTANPEVQEMHKDAAPKVPQVHDDTSDRVRVTVADEPVLEEFPPARSRRFSPPDAAAIPPGMGEPRPVAALSPAPGTEPRPARPFGPKLALAGLASAVLVSAASLLVLRPRAATPPPAPRELSIRDSAQPAAPARSTYAVRVGPYRQPGDVLNAHKRLRNLGFEPILVYGTGGTYIRALTTPEERKAMKIARGLQGDGFAAIVTESAPDSGLLGALDAAEPRYRVAGVRVDFEGGQSRGWEVSGSAVSMRNSSLFSFTGEHALEVALRETSHGSPAILRLRPESVVLPQDRFVARVLQPTSAGGRLGAAFYVIDAQGTTFRNTSRPLQPAQWVEMQVVISPHVVLPIQEVGIEFRAPRDAWTGAVYIDRIEQQRPR